MHLGSLVEVLKGFKRKQTYFGCFFWIWDNFEDPALIVFVEHVELDFYVLLVANWNMFYHEVGCTWTASRDTCEISYAQKLRLKWIEMVGFNF